MPLDTVLVLFHFLMIRVSEVKIFYCIRKTSNFYNQGCLEPKKDRKKHWFKLLENILPKTNVSSTVGIIRTDN